MKISLDQLTIVPLSGNEPFHANSDALGFSLKDFWSWGVSDSVVNLIRGHLAEFIVGKAIGSPGTVRNEWAAYDLLTKNGKKIEVKSAAYLQSWSQDDYSTIQFNVEKTKQLDQDKGYIGEPIRCADVYVFAVLKHKDKATIDPLNVNQWEFYVLPARTLNERTRSQHSITLKTLRELSGEPIGYFGLKKKVDALVTDQRSFGKIPSEKKFVDI